MMSARHLSRRSFLAAAAGVAASGLRRPAAALSLLAPEAVPPLLERRSLGALPAGERTVALGRRADLVAIGFSAPAGTQVQLSFRAPDGRLSPWLPARGCGWSAPASGSGAIVSGPLWTGGTSVLRLRASRPLSAARLYLIDASGGLGARRQALAQALLGRAAALPRATPVLQAGPGQPPVIARRAWARGFSHPRVAPEYGSVRMAFVHHTENPNGYLPGEVPAMLRAIFLFHREVHGWNDIGYNFVIDRFGRVFEARAGGIDEPVVGAQAGGYNLASTGVAVLGSFSSRTVSPAAKRALARLLAWKLALHGVPARGNVSVRVNPAGASYSRFPANALVALPHIAGHRDGDATECPGNALYGELPALRRAALRLAGSPARVTLAAIAQAPAAQAPAQQAPAQQAPAGAGQAPAPAPPAAPAPAGESAPGPTPAASPPLSYALVGRVALLDGSAVAGAPVQLQARRVARRGELVQERTLAEASTDAEGGFSLPVTVSQAAKPTALRVLCPGASGRGTTVSDPLQLKLAAVGAPAAPAGAMRS